jgi:two-component system, cell cycle response regulator
MKENVIKVLLIEDNESYAGLIIKMLVEKHSVSFDVAYADTLQKGLVLLAKEDIDAVLLDLLLPDAKGLEAFFRIYEQFPEVPIVVLTAVADEEVAIRAVQSGAQDYLIKGSVEADLLIRSIRYAIERQRMQMQLRSLSLLDELTRLYNRRGFSALAEQFTKLSIRKKRRLLVMFGDVDCLKRINDGISHKAGDRALIATAGILKQTFRETDVLARVGGDEFAVIAAEFSGTDPQILSERLTKNIEKFNSEAGREFDLSISFGVAEFDPENPESVEDLLAKADKLMYEQKRSKNLGRK